MGTRGPIPKRIGDRLGNLTKADRAAVTQVTMTGPVKVPPAGRHWHPLARDWYRSLAESGQSRYYEPSDWQAARLVAEQLTRLMKLPEPFVDSPAFRTIWATMNDLLTTEASRRRVKFEVSRKPLASAPASVAKIDDYRAL
jgi:hypothetical protein